MGHILTIVMVFWLTNRFVNVKAEILSVSLPNGEGIVANEQNVMLCKLPQYPKRGGYVVLGEKGAGPGDAFANVSLVQYTTDRDNQVFEIKRLSCFAGEWEQDIFEYDGKALYFYTSWCPYFCSSFSSERWTEYSPPNVDKAEKRVTKPGPHIVMKRSTPNNTMSQLCRLPPYPSRGTYAVQDNLDAEPGDSFQNVSLIQYTSDEHNKVVTIEHFKCSSGVWYQKIFQEASESLYFYSSWCPTLCSQCFGEKLADRQYSSLSKSQALKKKDEPKTKADYCTVPPYPEFGNYSIIGESTVAHPGDVHHILRLNYTCSAGYTLVGSGNVYCLKGVWSDDLPKCSISCSLIRQPGVEYLCGQVGSDDSLRPCAAQVQEGFVVIPRCSSPYYQSKSPLRQMICEHGEWNNVPDCRPVCGLRVQADATADARVRAPWHVAIFYKAFPPLNIKCGGTIVARNLVISAIGCFIGYFGDRLLPVNFFVIAGKLYRSLHQPNDDKAQLSEVTSIKYSSWHSGVFSGYQHDIALLFLAAPFVFNEYVWPVCLNFDKNLDEMQLTEGRLGMVAGWGRSDWGSSEVLRIVELPNIDIHKCIIKAMNTKSRYGEERQITTDKICAGNDTGTPLCMEDNGGGFVVAETDSLDPRRRYHYLRGVVSLYNRNLCNEVSFSVFTKVSAHEHFIRNNFDDFLFFTGSTTSEDINPKKQETKLCQLPPYPKHGGYVVLHETGVAPGDAFGKVSLVQYTMGRHKEVFEIKRFTCSFGQWYQDVIEYESETLHFYTSWCPYLCSSLLSNQWTECSTPSSGENLKSLLQSGRRFSENYWQPNDTKSQNLCLLPPYPSNGTYVVQNRPDARPGDTFQNVSLVQYSRDEHNKVITIKHFSCSFGACYQKIFQEVSESLRFHSSWCPYLRSE